MRTLTVLGCCGVLLSSCLSAAVSPFQGYANAWVGKPVDRIVAATQRPESYASRNNFPARFYPLANGNEVYVEAEREGCVVHWEFNQQRVIVGYKTEGKRCH